MTTIFQSESDRLFEFANRNNWNLESFDTRLLEGSNKIRVAILMGVRRRRFPDAPKGVWRLFKSVDRVVLTKKVGVKAKYRKKRRERKINFDVSGGPNSRITMKSWENGSYAEFVYVGYDHGSKSRGYEPLK